MSSGPPMPDDARVATYLRALAAEPTERLPGAAQLRWRAELLRDLKAKEARRHRLTRPLRWTVAALTAVIGLMLSLWTISTFVSGASFGQPDLTAPILAWWAPTLFGGAWAVRTIVRG